jgi:peroxiredoxin
MILRMTNLRIAPELDVAGWVSGEPTWLADLRGRVVMLETFQMLCPGCVRHGLPLAQRVRRSFPPEDVVVIGLHTVFEHHEVMGRDALAAFVSEYGWEFPVAIDRHDDDPVPVTMRRYGLQGTPSTVLVDRDGHIRLSAFGAVDELTFGSALGRLLEAPSGSPVRGAGVAHSPDTTAGVCEHGGGCS